MVASLHARQGLVQVGCDLRGERIAVISLGPLRIDTGAAVMISMLPLAEMVRR
jgi:hypothetical protein